MSKSISIPVQKLVQLAVLVKIRKIYHFPEVPIYEP